MKVKDIMTRDLFHLRKDRQIGIAEDVMKWHHIRHVPVVNEDMRIVGMVTYRDLLRAMLISEDGLTLSDQRRLFEVMTVKEIMSPRVVTTTPETDVKSAAKAMADNKVGCLPVLESDRLVGIVTEADFVKLVASNQNF